MNTERDFIDGLLEQKRENLAALEATILFERQYIADLQARRDALSSPETAKKASGAILAKGTIEAGGMTDQIVKLFDEEPGQELQAAQVARDLASRGATTKSKRGLLPMVISTLSRRKDVFAKVARGRYKLKKRAG